MEDIDRIYKKIAGDGKALDVLFAMLAVARLHRLEVSLKSNMTRHLQPM